MFSSISIPPQMNAVMLKDLVLIKDQNILVNIIVMQEMWLSFSCNDLSLIAMTNHQKWLKTNSSLVISDKKKITHKKRLIDEKNFLSTKTF